MPVSEKATTNGGEDIWKVLRLKVNLSCGQLGYFWVFIHRILSQLRIYLDLTMRSRGIRGTCTSMLIAVPFTIAEFCNQPKCQKIKEWINKM